MSGPTEAIPPPDIIFKGTDGNECEAFVVAIQDFALAKGLDEDYHWMLRHARSRLRGKALRWYTTLDSSIKKDWELFVQALFAQYPLVEEPGAAEITTPVWSATTLSPSPSIVTLPANSEASRNLAGQHDSVPPNPQAGHEEPHNSHISNERTSSTRHYDASSTGRQIGLLRIVGMEGTVVPQYVWWDNIRYNTPPISTTINRHEAPVVSFVPSSVPHAIGYLGSSGGSINLALPWTDPKVEYYAIHGFPNNRIITSTTTENISGFVAKAWNILADGTLQATISCYGWKEEAKFTTTEVHVNAPGDDIRFVKPGALLEQDKPDRNPIHPFVRARIVFEPL